MSGLFIILIASFFFCFQNVIVRVLFSEHLVLGAIPLGGYVAPEIQHSFLLLLMRMLLVVPLMASLSPRLYPLMQHDLRALGQPNQRPTLRLALCCGGLMFLYLALLYLSVGMIPTGIALTLFFTYPLFTALFSWVGFGDRPTAFRWLIMAIVLLGGLLTIPQFSLKTDDQILIGVVTGVLSGVAYALYTVVAQKCFERLHPFPFTWISFTTTLILCAVFLLGWQIHTADMPWTPLWIGGLASGLVTFVGHTLNNIGIQRVGATTAAMVGVTNPCLTALLAWLTLGETLHVVQIVGIGIVTLGIVLLSQEKAHTTS
ncbi:MAG TPA: DMT family transporter [Synechococcales cyanobacterium M55_K2018_004]|nr:DMT family transporter [Synechococcales cyanobacterium M55_K2018_004]